MEPEPKHNVTVHGPLSLHTKLEHPSIAKLFFYVSRYGLWMALKFCRLTALGACIKGP